MLEKLNFDYKTTEEVENGFDYTYILEFLNEDNAKKFVKYYETLLEDFEDTEVHYYWEEEDEEIENKGNLYSYYGMKESDFI